MPTVDERERIKAENMKAIIDIRIAVGEREVALTHLKEVLSKLQELWREN